MSTSQIAIAPFLNLLLFVLFVSGMGAGARWLERRFCQEEDRAEAVRDEAGTASLQPSRAAFGTTPSRMRRPIMGSKRWPDFAHWLAVPVHALWLVFGVTVAVQLLFIGRIPAALNLMELGFAGETLKILQGQGPGIFGLDWAGQPSWASYLLALAWQLFGADLFIARAVFGLIMAAAAPLLFLLLIRFVAVLPAMLAAILFGFSQPWLQVSRQNWLFGVWLTLTLLAAWLLMRALERQQLRHWIFWGVSLGVLLYSYPFGRLSVLGLFLYLGGRLWLRRAQLEAMGWQNALYGAALAFLLCCLFALPQLLSALGQGQPIAITKLLLVPALSTAGQQAAQTQIRWPDPLSCLLGIAGLATLVAQRRRVGLWWGLALLVPLVALLGGSLRGAALLVALPPFFGLVAIFLDRLWQRAGGQAAAVHTAVLGWIFVLALANFGFFSAWVNSAAAIAEAGPTVPTSDFYLWRDFQLAQLAEQQGLISVQAFNDLPVATIVERIALAREAAGALAGEGALRNDLATEVATFGKGGDGVGQLRAPQAVAIDRAGNFYVLDVKRALVLTFGPQGQPITEWSPLADCPHPQALVILPDQTLLLVDSDTGKLVQYDLAGKLLGSWQPLPQPGIVRGMNLGTDGQIYLAYTARNQVVALPANALADGQGKAVTPAKGSEYSQPTSATMSARSILFVYEPDSKRLRGYSANGSVLFTRTAPGASTLQAGAIAILPDGRLALADSGQRQVLIYSASGTLLGSFPVTGQPQGIAITADGHVVVTDREGGQIRIYQLKTP